MGPLHKLKVFLLKKFILENPTTCAHEWMIYSTALNQHCLELHCNKCAVVGSVFNPTEEEWKKAFHAPDNPYRWHDNQRVTVGTYQML